MKRIALAVLLAATSFAPFAVETASAYTCRTTCNTFGNQQTCRTTCF